LLPKILPELWAFLKKNGVSNFVLNVVGEPLKMLKGCQKYRAWMQAVMGTMDGLGDNFKNLSGICSKMLLEPTANTAEAV